MRVKHKLEFADDIAEDLAVISNEFNKSSASLFVVGGAVRDAILRKVPKDIDLATNLSPSQIEVVLANIAGAKILGIGRSFGVMKIMMPSGNDYEIATFREDVGSGRRPDSVVFSTIEFDVLRRDFTMNALFYDLHSEEIVDLVGGIPDALSGIVRCVGSPEERFSEDRLRIMRALRFAAAKGSLHEDTRAALFNCSSLKGVSHERIRVEFLNSIVKARSAQAYLDMVDEFGMWNHILPGLNISMSQHFSQRPNVLIALLLRGNEPKHVAKILNELTYSSDEVKNITFLIELMSLNLTNMMQLQKKRASCALSLEEINEFVAESGCPDRLLLHTFINFSPSTTGAMLLEEGFSGKELGIELQRRNAVEFEQFYEDKRKRFSYSY